MEKFDSIVHSFSEFAFDNDNKMTEQEAEIFASYRPSFMEIKLPFNFQGDLDSLSDKELASLFHEYVHYLQNLFTPWGLYTSVTDYGIMYGVYKRIHNTDSIITIPVTPETSAQFDNQLDLVKHGNGFIDFLSRRTWIIDKDFNVRARRTRIKIGNQRVPAIYCKFKLDDGTEKEILLGAKIIKESMAGMMQQLIDPSASYMEYDIPYNFIRILCESMFPKVAKDPIKMITICYLSLFSMSPAEVLFNELERANMNPQMSAIDLVDNYMQNYVGYMGNNRFSVVGLYERIKEIFLDTLEKTLMFKPLFIQEVLNRADLSQGYIPLLSILYGEGISRERVIDLMKGLGLPWIWTADGTVNSKLMDKGMKEAEDIPVLVSHNAIFSYLRYPNYSRVCPLRPFCSKSKTIQEGECLDNKPWEGKDCIMAFMANWLELDNKTIKYST